MNYKHAFHAGNHTEVFKHSVLCLLLLELRKKTKPFTVVDTHAGSGTYDLRSEMARKTGEAADGIARVIHKTVPTAAPYLDLVRHLNQNELAIYPGSPTIIQNFLRPEDQLIACDLREHDVDLLRKHLHWDKRIAIHHRDGYEAIQAFVPPTTRRGLVFIDPPFERADEFEKLAECLNAGIKKWPTGIFAAWYPIKDRSGVSKIRKQFAQ